jgi:hypothetical protein
MKYGSGTGIALFVLSLSPSFRKILNNSNSVLPLLRLFIPASTVILLHFTARFYVACSFHYCTSVLYDPPPSIHFHFYPPQSRFYSLFPPPLVQSSRSFCHHFNFTVLTLLHLLFLSTLYFLFVIAILQVVGVHSTPVPSVSVPYSLYRPFTFSAVF